MGWGLLLPGLARAWWKCPERPKKTFKKLFSRPARQHLRHNIRNFTDLVVRIIKYQIKIYKKCVGGGNFWGCGQIPLGEYKASVLVRIAKAKLLYI